MTNQQASHPKKKRRRIGLIILVSFIVLLIVFRLFLPTIVLKFVNNKLGSLQEYYGQVSDIDIALIRGAYQIKGIEVQKIDQKAGKGDTIPFFKSPLVDLSVQWNAIFKGEIVGEIIVDEPVVNFVKGKHEDKEAKKDTGDFKTVIEDLMPLTINRFEIHNGEIHYIDKNSSPKIDVSLKDLQITAENLSNVNDSSEALPAGLKATGNAYDGNFDLNVKFNALEEQPTFDLNAKVDKVNMVKLNDFFKAYGKFDVEHGIFGLYTEFAAKDGAFKGYVKPLMQDVKILSIKEDKDQGIKILWEAVVEGVSELFENQRKEQVATKLPIEGRFDNPETGLWTAINYVLRNAFVFALRPTVDNTIDIGKVEEQPEEDKTFLQKVFGKKNKEEKK